MSHLLVPRLTVGAALARLGEIEVELRGGTPAKDLVREQLGPAIPNPTGGSAATESSLHQWRSGVLDVMAGVDLGSATDNAVHSMCLGRAIADVVNPSPSDVAHDGVWSFLSLMLFPDVLASRWPAASPVGELPRDRWIGRQAGRDRNYLKLAWRRWRILGIPFAFRTDNRPPDNHSRSARPSPVTSAKPAQSGVGHGDDEVGTAQPPLPFAFRTYNRPPDNHSRSARPSPVTSAKPAQSGGRPLRRRGWHRPTPTPVRLPHRQPPTRQRQQIRQTITVDVHSPSARHG